MDIPFFSSCANDRLVVRFTVAPVELLAESVCGEITLNSMWYGK